MTDNSQTSHSGRKRRVRKRRPRRHRDISASRGGSLVRRVFIMMSVCGVLYSLYIIDHVWTAVGPMHGVAPGMTKQEVLYRLGPPVESPQVPGTWRYGLEGNRLTLKFGSDQRVLQVGCEEVAPAQRPCANILGVMVNTSEAVLKLRLGPPDREVYDQGDKLVVYDRLGVLFRLRQSRVVAIIEYKPGSLGAHVLEAVWVLLP